MAYHTLFSGLGIHHSNAGLQISTYQFMGFVFSDFYLMRDGCASNVHIGSPSTTTPASSSSSMRRLPRR
jgi:hypothetical protein